MTSLSRTLNSCLHRMANIADIYFLQHFFFCMIYSFLFNKWIASLIFKPEIVRKSSARYNQSSFWSHSVFEAFMRFENRWNFIYKWLGKLIDCDVRWVKTTSDLTTVFLIEVNYLLLFFWKGFTVEYTIILISVKNTRIDRFHEFLVVE